MIRVVCFSPTGNTEWLLRRIVAVLQRRWNMDALWSPYTTPAQRERFGGVGEGDVVLWGAPVYAGRHPNKLTPFIKEHLRGHGNPAILVATYGGRSFDNALAEMLQLALQAGLRPVAAAAMPMPHAFGQGIGSGYPAPEHLSALDDWVRRINPYAHQPLALPGDADAPYYQPLRDDGEPARFLKAAPVINPGRCTHCGRCEKVCPMGSIDANTMFHGICIKCMACVRYCPQGTITFDDPDLLSHIRMLRTHCRPQTPLLLPAADPD